MAEKKIIGWFTTKTGKHVPIFEGESKQDAINRSIAKDSEDKKAKQIAQNKAQADQASGKKHFLITHSDAKEIDKSNNDQLKQSISKLESQSDISSNDKQRLGYMKRQLDKRESFENNKDIKFSDYYDFIYQNSALSSEEAKKVATENWNKGVSKQQVLKSLQTTGKQSGSKPVTADDIVSDLTNKYKLKPGQTTIPLTKIKADLKEALKGGDWTEDDYLRMLGKIFISV